MGILNDFEKMCKELDKQKCCMCRRNKFVCAKRKVMQYVGKDRNKLMSLKSEALGGGFIEFTSFALSVAGYAVSIMALILSICESKKYDIKGSVTSNSIMATAVSALDVSAIGHVIIVVALAIFVFALVFKFGYVYKWRYFIITAIEELDEVIK